MQRHWRSSSACDTGDKAPCSPSASSPRQHSKEPHSTEEKETFQIFVTTPGSGTIAVLVEGDTRIKGLKSQIQGQEGVPATEQRIIFRGKQLEDHHTLDSYKTDKDCTVHASFRLLGGAGQQTGDEPQDLVLKLVSFYSIHTPDETISAVRNKGENLVREREEKQASRAQPYAEGKVQK